MSGAFTSAVEVFNSDWEDSCNWASSVFTYVVWLCVLESLYRTDVDVVCSVKVRSSSVEELIDAESCNTYLLLEKLAS